MSNKLKPIQWENGVLKLIDQTRLPTEFIINEYTDYIGVAKAIKDMIVRGAPAIGVTAAYGIVLGAREFRDNSKEVFMQKMNEVCDVLRNTRPTAVNLFWAIDRMYAVLQNNENKEVADIINILEKEANAIYNEDVEINRAIGQFGNSLIHPGDIILTHCNAGALATADFGTALGVIRAAHEAGKNISVFADETRPFLQGARLTAFELQHEGIPVTLITDNMAGHFMKQKKINCVIVGADRITTNGDVANKIGTYSVAVLAKENNIPFYVAAPISTIDFSLEDGEQIPIEERNPQEVTHIAGVQIAPEGIKVANPAFDVTPNKYVTAIITEKGVIYPPYNENILKLKNEK
ncbi:MAG: methylthioribose-phosphate isomerase [Petroclostridium sp.]|jgi:methylthioribose-1-phosphate isomerase|nr:mtnA [Clostridia bacterium]MDK2810619.1 methylthioribose-phosphate isomerase [Petroclostridium sp.]